MNSIFSLPASVLFFGITSWALSSTFDPSGQDKQLLKNKNCQQSFPKVSTIKGQCGSGDSSCTLGF